MHYIVTEHVLLNFIFYTILCKFITNHTKIDTVNSVVQIVQINLFPKQRKMCFCSPKQKIFYFVSAINICSCLFSKVPSQVKLFILLGKTKNIFSYLGKQLQIYFYLRKQSQRFSFS